MARIRTIKPEFFQHETLFEAEETSKLPLRLAYVGLWTQCDRDGRFEWRPRQLKLNVLPYDNCDFSAVLSTLESNGFIVRYDADGKSFGCIPSWTEHQYINSREPSSTIPAPTETNTEKIQISVESDTGTSSVRALREGKGTGTGKERERPRAAAPATPGLEISAWERWDAYRTEIKKPLKPASLLAAAKALAGFGANQLSVVEQSIAHGWQGLFEIKSMNDAAKNQAHKTAPTVAELEAREAACGLG
jgi:hypothetical protein